jgi:putative tryptophan/tyrosine transport system substrate-binding protein
MRRREFIAGLGGAAAWPVVTSAQQSRVPTIGVLHLVPSPDRNSPGIPALLKGLGSAGFIEGQNLAIEYRGANNQSGQLRALADDLVRHRVAAIAAVGSGVTALAAKAATTAIPIVFAAPNNPVELGLVATLNRPSGNLTGVTGFIDELASKRVAMLHELAPRAAIIAVLSTLAESDSANLLSKHVSDAAARLGLQSHFINADSEPDLDPAFEKLASLGAGALLVDTNAALIAWRSQIVALAARRGIPTVYARREFVEAGGLMSYGANFDDLYHQAGLYVGRILKGEKPADLPVVQPAKFELAINLKTAKALGLIIPESLLATADEVIQ